ANAAARDLVVVVDSRGVPPPAGVSPAAAGADLVALLGVRGDHPADTTGAGDLLAAAYIWAELREAELVDRLRWAVLYATLAVTSPTGIGGAVPAAPLVGGGGAPRCGAPPPGSPALSVPAP